MNHHQAIKTAKREQKTVGRQKQVRFAEKRDLAGAQIDQNGKHDSSLPLARLRLPGPNAI